MCSQISTEFRQELRAVIVRFPDPVTLKQISEWIPRFVTILEENEPNCTNLLLDTTRHNFEHIECLRLLKTTLTMEPVVLRNLKTVAFVQPKYVREPIRVSTREAYFASFEDALLDLQTTLSSSS